MWQHLVNGLTTGSIYALIALGYTMVYGILKFINFAHGDILMIGTYCSLFTFNLLRGPQPSASGTLIAFSLAFIVGLLISAGLGVLIERLAYRPLRKASRLAPLLSAIGVSIILVNLAAMLWGTKSRRFDYPFANDPITVGQIAITPHQILVLVSALILMLGLKLFIHKTRWGKAMRATSENPAAAQLMGINTDFIISLTFALGSALATAGGILVSMDYKLYPTIGTLIGLKAFIAAVAGGIGNITGALLGGLLLGILETLGVAALGIPNGLKDTIAFSILIIILLFKPSGLLGKNQKEKI